MRRTALCLTCVLTGAAAVAGAQPPPENDSFERIREALGRPPSTLLLELPKADFFIHIEQRRPLQDIFERPPWVTVPPEFAPPPGSNRDPHDAIIASVSIDPGAIAHAISRAIRAREARDEVHRAITEYCTRHRDEPGADAICGRPER